MGIYILVAKLNKSLIGVIEMTISNWTKKDLLEMKDKGYKIVSCENEEQLNLYLNCLKENKKCARVGRYDNKLFILTKERGSIDNA